MAGRRRVNFAERREQRAAVDDPELVLAAAVRFLESRARSTAEVRRRLTGAGYRAELVDGAIARLVELAMLDDEAFARSWIESRDRARPRGEHALRRELQLKGVDRTVIDGLLATRAETAAEAGAVTSADDDAATRLLARHARALDRVADPRARRQRAYALLAHHGFDPETCSSASRAFLSDQSDGDGMGAPRP